MRISDWSSDVCSSDLFALGFLLLGGGSLDGMMHQLDNLARRYVEADAARVQSFRDLFLAAHLAVTILLIILRQDRIVPAQLPEGLRDHGCTDRARTSATHRTRCAPAQATGLWRPQPETALGGPPRVLRADRG